MECKKVFSISILHAHCNNKLILYIIIKEKGESYNLYVDKCQILKTFYLCKVSFRINLKWNVNKYFQFQFYMHIVIISLYYISL